MVVCYVILLILSVGVILFKFFGIVVVVVIVLVVVVVGFLVVDVFNCVGDGVVVFEGVLEVDFLILGVYFVDKVFNILVIGMDECGERVIVLFVE